MLLAHSDVFQAMFSHKESLENVQSRMTITDFDPEIIKQMLEYLYTGELSKKLSDENLVELLKIAEKYNLKMLKSASEAKLIQRLFFMSKTCIEKILCNKK